MNIQSTQFQAKRLNLTVTLFQAVLTISTYAFNVKCPGGWPFNGATWLVLQLFRAFLLITRCPAASPYVHVGSRFVQFLLHVGPCIWTLTCLFVAWA